MQTEPEGAGKGPAGATSGAGGGPKVEQNGVISYVTVEVPLIEGGAGFNKDVSQWTPSDVKNWIAAANGGKFSHIVLPAGLDGEGLMSLNEGTLSDLFEAQFDAREARGRNEGGTWVIGNGGGGGGGETEEEGGGQAAEEEREAVRGVLEIGRNLFQSLRMEQKKVEKLRREEVRCHETTHRINAKSVK